MTDTNTQSRSFRSRSDHFLAAMAVVYRDISHKPGNLSSRTNLEYLRVIKLHLDRMGNQNKHFLAPSLTRLMEDMVSAAEAAVAGAGTE